MPKSNSQLFGNIYEGRKVLVTGHTGFKGSWTALWLDLLGASVIGYALEPPTKPSHFETCKLENKIDHIEGDIRDLANLKNVFNQYKPDIVFHMAAQPLVRESYAQPVETYETNVMGTVNVFEAARKCPSVRVIINVTSDKCYQNNELDYAYKEDDAMGGHDPYSSSKGCSELVTSAYRNSFFNESQIRLASVRAGNVIGGGDWAKDRLLPDCFRALGGNKSIIVRNPNAVRPWQHVLEPLSGYLWLASLLWNGNEKFSSGWNFGPDEESNLKAGEVVDSVIKHWGEGSWDKPVNSDSEPHEANLLMLDHSKAKEHLYWMPTYDIEAALQATTEWYKAFIQGKDPKGLSINDIEQYVKRAKKKQLKWSLSKEKAGVV